MKHAVLLASAAALCAAAALADTANPFVRSGSIGARPDPMKDCPAAAFALRPVSCWVGQKFLVLPKPKSRQKAGYPSLKPAQGKTAGYDELAGHFLTAAGVDPAHNVVKFKDDAGGREYLGVLNPDESVADLALVADLQAARERWLGKNVWLLQPNLVGYDEPSDSFSTVKAARFSGAKVTDVVAGWDSHLPVRLILQTADGAEGYRDVNVSGTNVPETSRGANRFDDFFLESNPREAHVWPAKIWDAIQAREVFPGMSAEQARLSWGKPDTVTRSLGASGKPHEQWVYAGGTLSFDDNVLTAVQK